jgi:hypothetical protein
MRERGAIWNGVFKIWRLDSEHSHSGFPTLPPRSSDELTPSRMSTTLNLSPPPAPQHDANNYPYLWDLGDSTPILHRYIDDPQVWLSLPGGECPAQLPQHQAASLEGMATKPQGGDAVTETKPRGMGALTVCAAPCRKRGWLRAVHSRVCARRACRVPRARALPTAAASQHRDGSNSVCIPDSDSECTVHGLEALTCTR